jgi:hypothetical protein
MISPHLHGIAGWDFQKKERKRIDPWQSRSAPETSSSAAAAYLLLFEGVSASQDTVERCRRCLLSVGKSRPHRYERKTTRTKFFDTLITVVRIRVISFAILVFVTIDTVPS